jgi:hypothetical protein
MRTTAANGMKIEVVPGGTEHLSRLLASTLCCLMLAACGSGSDQEASKPAATQAAKSATTQSSTSAQSSRIKAVQTSPGSAPLEMQFELSARPELGKPLDINLYVLGLRDATEVQLSFQPGTKLELLKGAQASFPALKAGEAQAHSISVRSSNNGIFVVDVNVTATVDGHPQTLTFAIPVAFVPADPA